MRFAPQTIPAPRRRVWGSGVRGTGISMSSLRSRVHNAGSPTAPYAFMKEMTVSARPAEWVASKSRRASS